MLSAIAPIALLFAAGASATTPPGVAAFVSDHHITRYRLALADLNGDDQPEALIYAIDTAGGGEADLCGSGGCDLYVLSPTATGYRLVTNISITRPPIRVLPTITHGWHDLAVLVAGGGIIPGYEARLRFNGSSYPENPSVLPATHLEDVIGKVVINEPSLETIRSVYRVIAHLDLTSFPNSIGPRREPGKKSFADYGFTEVELTPDGAMLYRPDHGWMMYFRILKQDRSPMQICFGDRGLQRPQDVRAPSYNAQSALAISASEEQWWKAHEQRGGFGTCRNDPPSSN